ncbi:MAG: GGDEF domain-containing protein [Cupriavidus sp.]|uniref:GGDEF domain-containing protein n=1 Tax=Cupriavidus pauculus TaxID=82633 RepID=UPI0007819298|nr:GGDEF domain-containing protein [Cupriavidus pauculus]MBU69078.1 GGDEF domain-containing protein [Cupriavidus sp.]KAB0601333.1 GGDEF domain-containing protein [Cupriavidus pauculus]MBY4732675.1 GGDEF domain-containing protein [Cupriavidus pauculus]MCM3605961.1 GGDEF domain-containing protein [Cupriavidus pauculus]UAL02997.1 GGDEF domain-containing protein [Cupriavidus pauculus]
MHLAQQTILVVMMVVFSSTLVMAAGLVLALRASDAGRLWATGHVVASGAGLVVAAGAADGSLQLAALGAGFYLIGRLTIYRGVRAYYGLPDRAALLRGIGIVAFVLMVLMAGVSDGRLLVHGVAYGMLAMISFATIVTMLGSKRGRTSIGGPLVLASHLVLLGSQVAALSYGAAFKGIAITPFFLQTSSSIWPLAPMVAVLLGLFGFSLMAMEQIIAQNENGARLDALTGLLNRGALDMTAVAMVARWQRDGDALSCLVIDVDHFKLVNDRHGHHAGDSVLREIATALDNSRRASDIAARYGGEEFCILCPHTDEHQATALANRILRKVRAIQLPGGGGHASVSIGIAQLHGGPPSREGLWRNLFADADRALYLAKQRGRDQFVLGSSMAEAVETDELQAQIDCVGAV